MPESIEEILAPKPKVRPRHSACPGIAAAAAWRLPIWDRYIIPKPVVAAEALQQASQ